MKKLVVVLSALLLIIVFAESVGVVCYAYANANRKLPVYKVDTAKRYVSISFDAAWGADKTRQILDICDEYGVKVTFFLVGFWIEKYPELVKEIDFRGHEIGTHSLTHPKMSTLGKAEITKELQQSSQMIADITEKKVTLFRPPFGDYDNLLIETANELGLLPIQWSVDSLDWKGISANEICMRVQKMTQGDIILCHNNSDHVVEALPVIFQTAVNKGLQFVPIGELVFKDNYQIDGSGVQHRLD